MKTALLFSALFYLTSLSAQAQDAAKNDTTIETVTVTGQKAAITRSIEGTTHDETNNPVAKTGTAADVLNTVPSVNVSPDGNVTLRGSSNVEVYVDGKPSAMLSGASRGLTLQSMSGDDIASIEVITNPSAKYDANGSSIINIVLKKDRKLGANATLVVNFGDSGRKNGAINSEFTQGPLTLYANGNVREDMRPKRDSTVSSENDPTTGISSSRNQNSFVDARRYSFSLAGGADYDFSPSDTLDAQLAWKSNNSRNTLDEFNQLFDGSGAPTSAFDNRSTGPRRQTDTSERADFTHKADDGGQWDFTVANSETQNFQDKSYSEIFSFPVMPDQDVRVLTNSDRRLLQISGDGVMPTGENAQLSFGFDFRTSYDSFRNLNAAIDPASGVQTVNPDLTNQADITRRIGAAYVTWQKAWGRLTALAGLRFETAHTSIMGTPSPIAHGESNSNPTLHLNYEIDDNQRITANFSRTSQRPDTANLDPFSVYVDSQDQASGNANLKLQTVIAGELGYEFDKDGADQVLTAYYRQSQHTVTDFSSFLSDDVLLTTKRNGGAGTSAGLEYTIDGALTPHLKYDLSVNLFHAQLQAVDLTGIVANSRTSYAVKASLDYSPTARDQLRLDANFIGETITALGTQSGTAMLNALWQHRLAPGIFATLTANDITDGAKTIGITRTDTVFRTDDSYIRGRQLFLGIQYKF